MDRQGSELFRNFGKVQRQHHNNLVALLSKSLDEGDFSTTADICALLLAAEDPKSVAGKQEGKSVAKQRVTAVLDAAAECVLRQSAPLGQVQQQLQRLAQAHVAKEAGERAALDLAMLAILRGDLEQGHRMLASRSSTVKGGAGSEVARVRTAYCALVRYQQWLDMMKDLHKAAATIDLEEGAPAGAPSTTAAHAAGTDGSLQRLLGALFTYDSRLWIRAQGKRELKDAWKECELELREALVQGPSTTLLSLLLCHVYVVAGKLRAAVATAQASAAASPQDVDAHMLLGLMQGLVVEMDEEGALGMQPLHTRAQAAAAAQKQHHAADNVVESYALASLADPVHVEVHAHLVALHADPTASLALQRVCAHSSHCMECSVGAVDACLTYLDMLGTVPALQLEVHALSTLCSALVHLAHGFLVARGVEGPQAGAGPQAGTGDDADTGAASQPVALEVVRWRLVRGLLHDRAYWWPATCLVLRPPGSSRLPVAAGGEAAGQEVRVGPSSSKAPVDGTRGVLVRSEGGAGLTAGQPHPHGGTADELGAHQLWAIVAAFMLGPRHPYVLSAMSSEEDIKGQGKEQSRKKRKKHKAQDSPPSSDGSEDDSSSLPAKLQASIDTATKAWLAEHVQPTRAAAQVPAAQDPAQLPDIPEGTDPLHARLAHAAWTGVPATWPPMPMAAQLVFPAKRRALRREAGEQGGQELE